jgi:hypothetical protein
VAGVVTKGQCIHCNAEISAQRGAGTSAMITHLKRCKVLGGYPKNSDESPNTREREFLTRSNTKLER